MTDIIIYTRERAPDDINPNETDVVSVEEMIAMLKRPKKMPLNTGEKGMGSFVMNKLLDIFYKKQI